VSVDQVATDDLLFHDESADSPALAYLLSRMRYPQFPEPIGVFRSVERPIYDEQINLQVDQAIAERGAGNLNKLFTSGDTWTVT
jgi:2-oxoglutarate ferredoxin oxidoreductase subunit beta